MQKTVRINSIRLDPLPSSDRDQGQCNHGAIATGSVYLPLKTVARRPGFIANRNVTAPRMLLQQICDAGGCVVERAQLSTSSPRPPPAIATASLSFETSFRLIRQARADQKDMRYYTETAWPKTRYLRQIVYGLE